MRHFKITLFRDFTSLFKCNDRLDDLAAGEVVKGLVDLIERVELHQFINRKLAFLKILDEFGDEELGNGVTFNQTDNLLGFTHDVHPGQVQFTGNPD